MSNEDLKLALGDWIARARQNQSMTQQSLADAVGVGVTFLSKIENGKTWTSLSTLLAICHTLQVDPPFEFNVA